MEGNNNDNEELSFIHIAAATANVVRWLETTKDHQEDCDRDTGRSGEEKEKAERHRAYVDQRLKDLAAFERRFTRKDRS